MKNRLKAAWAALCGRQVGFNLTSEGVDVTRPRVTFTNCRIEDSGYPGIFVP